MLAVAPQNSRRNYCIYFLIVLPTLGDLFSSCSHPRTCGWRPSELAIVCNPRRGLHSEKKNHPPQQSTPRIDRNPLDSSTSPLTSSEELAVSPKCSLCDRTIINPLRLQRMIRGLSWSCCALWRFLCIRRRSLVPSPVLQRNLRGQLHELYSFQTPWNFSMLPWLPYRYCIV
jgi:hypothetical protein